MPILPPSQISLDFPPSTRRLEPPAWPKRVESAYNPSNPRPREAEPEQSNHIFNASQTPTTFISAQPTFSPSKTPTSVLADKAKIYELTAIAVRTALSDSSPTTSFSPPSRLQSSLITPSSISLISSRTDDGGVPGQVQLDGNIPLQPQGGAVPSRARPVGRTPIQGIASPVNRQTANSVREFPYQNPPTSQQLPDYTPTIEDDRARNSVQANPMGKSFYVKACAREQVGRKIKGKYQATAVSDTCLTVALITTQQYSIYSIGEQAMSLLISCGFHDGRFGASPETASKSPETMANPRFFAPTYVRAVMNDHILCIACAQSCIDVHLTPTGRRIGTITLPNSGQCSSLRMSPNSELLAVGMTSGEVLLYASGPSGDFDH